MVRIKVSHASTVRRISLPDGPSGATAAPPLTLPALHAALHALYPDLPPAPTLHFIDDESDLVLLATPSDLREALTLTPHLLRLTLTAPSPSAAAMASVAPPPPPPPPRPGLSFLDALAPAAASSAFPAALHALHAAPPQFPPNGSERAARRAVADCLARFVAHLRARGGAAGVPARVLTNALARVGSILAAAGVDLRRVALVLQAVEAAFGDAGVCAAVLGGDTGAADDADHGRRPAPPPLQYIVHAAETARAQLAAADAAAAIARSPGDKPRMFAARGALQRAALAFAARAARGDGGDDAAAALGAAVRAAAEGAGVGVAAAAAAAVAAEALARDRGARAAAVRIWSKRDARLGGAAAR